MVTECAVWMKF